MAERIPYGPGLLRSTSRYGPGSVNEGGFLSPRSAATRGIAKPAAGPEPLAPDDETLMPAPSVTGEAHGPGGTQGNPTRLPTLQAPPPEDGYGAPFTGNQADIDFQAEQAINKRYLLRLENIKQEADLLGNPQEKELEARKLTRALEDYQPAGVKPSIRFSQGGMMTEYLPDDRLPPEAPSVGDIRAERANSLALERNPTVAAKRMQLDADADNQAAAQQEVALYNDAVDRIKRDGRPDPEGRILQATNTLHAKLATLGIRPPAPVDPRRLPTFE